MGKSFGRNDGLMIDSSAIYGWPTITTVSLEATSWVESGSIWKHPITLTGAINISKIDIQPDATVFASMEDAGCTALYVENNAGTLNVCAVGAALTADVDVQVMSYNVEGA